MGAAAVATRVLPFRPRGLVVPQLTGVPLKVGGSAGEPDRARLALAMLDAGIGGPEAWSWSGRTAEGFIERALARWVAEQGGNTIEPWFDISLRLDVSLAPEWHRSDAPETTNGCVLLVLETAQCNMLAVADVLAWLERVHPRLPATVWSHLQELGRVARIYTWVDAEEFRQMARDSTDELELEEFDRDFPPVPVPEPLRAPALADATIARLRPRWPRDVRAVLDAARRVSAAARKYSALRNKVTASERRILSEGLLFDMDQEAPTLLVCEQPRDRTCAAIDEDLQYLGSDYAREPAGIWPIPRPRPADVRRSFARAAAALAAFRAFSEALDAIPIRVREGRPLAEVLAAGEDDTNDIRVRIA